MATEPAASIHNLTDEEFGRREAKRQALNVAARPRRLADRIDLISNQFDHDRPAAAIVADITSDYMQETGAAGSTFWGLIHDEAGQTGLPGRGGGATASTGGSGQALARRSVGPLGGGAAV